MSKETTEIKEGKTLFKRGEKEVLRFNRKQGETLSIKRGKMEDERGERRNEGCAWRIKRGNGKMNEGRTGLRGSKGSKGTHHNRSDRSADWLW